MIVRRAWLAVLVVLSVLNGACEYSGGDPAAPNDRLSISRAALQRIPAPGGAQLVESADLPKTMAATAEYRSAVPRAQLAQHYRDFMQRDGWTSCGETRSLRWGKDYGDRQLVFRKAGLHVILFFADEKKYGFDYSIAVRPVDPVRRPGDPAC